jgi:hypothetical protein
LQQSFNEQDKVYRGQIQLLEAQLQQLYAQQQNQQHQPATAASSDDVSGGRSVPPVLPHLPSNATIGSHTSSFASASLVSGDASGGAEAKLFAARQEVAKLKNSHVVLQKDLTQSQRAVDDLTRRVKENDDTIASLEIAFAALKTVHKNETYDRSALEGSTNLLRMRAHRAHQLIGHSQGRVFKHGHVILGFEPATHLVYHTMVSGRTKLGQHVVASNLFSGGIQIGDGSTFGYRDDRDAEDDDNVRVDVDPFSRPLEKPTRLDVVAAPTCETIIMGKDRLTFNSCCDVWCHDDPRLSPATSERNRS